MKKITFRMSSDFHVHFRDGPMLKKLIYWIASVYYYAVAMGNTKPPIVSGEQVANHRSEILKGASESGLPNFQPIMTVMLVYGMTPEILEGAYQAGARVLKLIPGGASTGSNHGVVLWDLPRFYPVLQKAMKLGMIFSVHCELIVNPQTGKNILLYDQERMGIKYFDDVIKYFPELKIIFEHISSKELCQYFLDLNSKYVAAGFTAHHPYVSYFNVCNSENRIINPYLYSKPIGKFQDDINAVRRLMTSGHPRSIYGSDLAAHPSEAKENKPYAAGILNLPKIAIPDLWQNVFLFDLGPGKKTKQIFENFTSGNGLRFYNLPDYDKTMTLINKKWKTPRLVEGMKVFKGGEYLDWQIMKENMIR
ncbi:hypothetical protein KAR28_01110 [Candidatus Parcubacteria bacterium]|nr:hypothetical protein [Candidatus Parcubacteria bacterium]